MTKHPMNPADLEVVTFATQTPALALTPKLPFTHDPTAETRCFFCPVDYTTSAQY